MEFVLFFRLFMLQALWLADTPITESHHLSWRFINRVESNMSEDVIQHKQSKRKTIYHHIIDERNAVLHSSI